VVDSKKLQTFATSLANGMNDEKPWQKIE